MDSDLDSSDTCTSSEEETSDEDSGSSSGTEEDDDNSGGDSYDEESSDSEEDGALRRSPPSTRRRGQSRRDRTGGSRETFPKTTGKKCEAARRSSTWSSGSEDNDDDDDEAKSKVDEAKAESDSDEEGSCPICMLKMKFGEVAVPDGGCKHAFCLGCLKEWSRNVATCPIDRSRFRNIIVKESVLGPEVNRLRVVTRRVELQEEPATVVEDAALRQRLLEQEQDGCLCEVCGSGHGEERLLLCDGCDLAYHLECLTPPLERVPRGRWYCPTCQSVGLGRGARTSSRPAPAGAADRSPPPASTRIRILQVLASSDSSGDGSDADQFINSARRRTRRRPLDSEEDESEAEGVRLPAETPVTASSSTTTPRTRERTVKKPKRKPTKKKPSSKKKTGSKKRSVRAKTKKRPSTSRKATSKKTKTSTKKRKKTRARKGSKRSSSKRVVKATTGAAERGRRDEEKFVEIFPTLSLFGRVNDLEYFGDDSDHEDKSSGFRPSAFESTTGRPNSEPRPSTSGLHSQYSSSTSTSSSDAKKSPEKPATVVKPVNVRSPSSSSTGTPKEASSLVTTESQKSILDEILSGQSKLLDSQKTSSIPGKMAEVYTRPTHPSGSSSSSADLNKPISTSTSRSLYYTDRLKKSNDISKIKGSAKLFFKVNGQSDELSVPQGYQERSLHQSVACLAPPKEQEFQENDNKSYHEKLPLKLQPNDIVFKDSFKRRRDSNDGIKPTSAAKFARSDDQPSTSCLSPTFSSVTKSATINSQPSTSSLTSSRQNNFQKSHLEANSSTSSASKSKQHEFPSSSSNSSQKISRSPLGSISSASTALKSASGIMRSQTPSGTKEPAEKNQPCLLYIKYYANKTDLHTAVIDELRPILREVYLQGKLGKETYKEVFRKCVKKVYDQAKLSRVNNGQIRALVDGYVKKYGVGHR